jgi:hypothetical protein
VTSKRSSLVIACGLAAAAVLGCQQAEEIQRYQVPRAPRIRMLAALIPHGERTWFVKVTGPDATVEEHKRAFRQFIGSFHFNNEDKGKPPLTWTVPGNWKEVDAKPARGEFQRFATFRLRAQQGDELELTIFALGRAGQAGDVLANVNRWRGQLGLEPVTAEGLKGLIDELKVEDTTAILVDMLGTGSRLAATRPPFAGGAKPGEAPVAANVPPTFQAPPGWKKAPLKAFSIATFQVGEGEPAVFVTVTPASGRLDTNLNRWREQVGLPLAKGAELKKDLREGKLADDLEAVYVEYLSPAGVANRSAIFGAIALGGGGIWFFKMSGPADAVTNQRAAFQEFLRSVRFAGGKEGHP